MTKGNPTPKKLNENLIILILAAIQFANVLDFVIVMPLGPHLIRAFEITNQQFGMIVSSYTFSAGIFGFLAAFFIDKFDRKSALLTLLIGFTIGTLLCAIANSYVFLISARIVAGMFGGAMAALVLSIVGDIIPYERRGAAMGKVMSAFAVASVIGVPIGLFLANKFDWHTPFFALTAFSAAIWIVAYFLLPSVNGHVEKSKYIKPIQTVKSILTNPNQLKALVLMMILMISGFTVIPYLAPFLVSNAGLPESELMYVYLFGGAFTLVSSILIGKLSDKYGKLRMFTIFNFLSIIPIIIVTNLVELPVATTLVITTFFFILVSGRSVPVVAIITASVQPEKRGSFMSLNSCAQQLSAGFASFIGGILITTTTTGKMENYWMAGVVAVVATLIASLLIRKVKPINQKDEELKINSASN